MEPITTIPPLSVEDFLHSLARTPTAARFEKRRRQANARDEATDQSKSFQNPKTAQAAATMIAQRTGTKSALKSVPLRPHHQRVEKTPSNFPKTTPPIRQHPQQASCSSTQECVSKLTLAAISAIKDAQIAALEFYKTRSTTSPQTSVPQVYDGRFEDADEQEFEEDAALISTPLGETELAEEAPVSKAADHPSHSSQRTLEATNNAAFSTAKVNASQDVVRHQDRPDQYGEEQNPNESVLPQMRGNRSEISAEAGQEEQIINHQQLVSSSRSPQISGLGQASGAADEPLDELDLELLQLGEEREDLFTSQSPGSSRDASREPSPHRRSAKRASQDIYDDQDQSDSNQNHKPSPAKRRKHLRQNSSGSEVREIATRGSQERNKLKDEAFTGEASAGEDDDQDGSYNPRLSKKKKKKNGSKNAKTKGKARLVDFGELNFCSSPRRTPFPENEDAELELSNDPIDAPSVPNSARSRINSRVGIRKSSSRSQKRRNHVRSRKEAVGSFDPLWNFRKLPPSIPKRGETGNRTPSGAPTYSDGFTQTEAKPIGRVMPMYRSRQRLPATSRPVIARMGELTITESHPILFGQEPTPRETARSKVKGKQSRKPKVNTERGNPVEVRRGQPQQHEQIIEQVENHDAEAHALETDPSDPEAVQPPKDSERIHISDPITASETVAKAIVDDVQLGIHDANGNPSDELPEKIDDNQLPALQNQAPNNPNPASKFPGSSLRRQVSFSQRVDVLTQFLTVSAPRRPQVESNSESEETDEESSGDSEEVQDQEMADPESGKSEEEQEIDSSSDDLSTESNSEQDEGCGLASDDETKDDTGRTVDVSSQDTNVEVKKNAETADSENETEQEDDDVASNGRIEEDEITDHPETTDYESTGENGTDDEDYEMLLESYTIRSTQPLAAPHDFVLEPEVLTIIPDPMANQVQEAEKVWRPRRPISTSKLIEVDEDLLDYSSPLRPYQDRNTNIRRTESKVYGNERKQPSPELPDSQGQEPSPEIFLMPETYFPRASQAIENEKSQPTMSQTQAMKEKSKGRSKSLPSRPSLSQSLHSSASNNDENVDGDKIIDGGGGTLSKSQMFRRTISSLPVPQSQVMGTRESQMSWRPENEMMHGRSNGADREVGDDLGALTRRAGIEFGTVAHATRRSRRTPSLPFVPPFKKL